MVGLLDTLGSVVARALVLVCVNLLVGCDEGVAVGLLADDHVWDGGFEVVVVLDREWGLGTTDVVCVKRQVVGCVEETGVGPCGRLDAIPFRRQRGASPGIKGGLVDG